AVKFDEPEQLPQPLRRLVADRDVYARRAQQHGLGEGDIVALQQALDGDICKADEALFALEVGEQAVLDDLRGDAESGRDALEDGRPVERRVAAARLGRGAEDRGPQLLG